MKKFPGAPNLDDLFLDMATAIELSDADRRIIENRYRKLKEHLERPSSPLAKYLVDDESRIYPQGSISIGTTIISGDDDDRFDVDAIVEINVPSNWSETEVLDLLYESLKGFPAAIGLERCTRCVQLQFAFMHMDVTIMDPASAPRPERVGDIFHSPDRGASFRVPANPYGFGNWFRASVAQGEGYDEFSEKVASRRSLFKIDRFATEPRAAEQDDLPPIVPPRLDGQQAVALKLFKRFINLRYSNRKIRKPPSVYSTKMSIDCGFASEGLAAQLGWLAFHVKREMEESIAANGGPDERNPEYEPDRLNDRWPDCQEDRRTLLEDMEVLLAALEKAHWSSFAEIASMLADLFGERLSERAVKAHVDRRDGRAGGKPNRYEKVTGTIIGASAPAAPAIARGTSVIPPHNFHCSQFADDESEDN